ncbi:MAG: MinD/ParA family ATP-binding protein [Leptolyngbya sp. IPPAS B-1204]|nr:MinD/ParA family protein [Elainella sp. C42_A2020_010]RNJ65133.1 MAG: MinD/ParA family protein [Leptolyngbya sp. IPPAS B-1204]
MPKIIAIHSYRGGTGKSNLTANLAAAIALRGNRVAVVDTDLQSPGIHTLFSIDEHSTDQTLNDYLWDRCPIQDTAYDVSSKLEIETTGRLFLVPASVNAEEIARILSEGYNVSLLNDGFRQLIKELELDYLFIDTHPGLSRETLLSIAVSNLLILILRPDQQDFQGTAVTIDVARQLKVRKLSLVINKVLSKLDRAALQQKVETTYNATVAGIFPLSEDMIELGSSGLFYLQHANHPFTQTLHQVATQIMNGP